MAFKYHQGSKAGGLGEEYDQSPTLTADWHQPAVCYDTTQVTNKNNRSNPRPGDPCHTLSCGDAPLLCQSQYGDVAGTPTARHDSSPCADRGMTVVCVADDNANAAVDDDLCGTLKVGGGCLE